jgi:hypothetical protein
MKRLDPVDDVALTHAHSDIEQAMHPVGDDRIDGLRVREFACACGFAAALLSRVDDIDPGPSWPYAFPPAPPRRT